MSGGGTRRGLVIAVDGPAASGKGTLARRLAAHYGLPCLDTGLLYRMVARAMLDAGHDIHNAEAATRTVAGFDQDAFPEERLRGREIGEAASVVAAMPAVRAGLLERQRRFASQPGGAMPAIPAAATPRSRRPRMRCCWTPRRSASTRFWRRRSASSRAGAPPERPAPAARGIAIPQGP